MANAFTATPMLRLGRSPQSGQKVMTAVPQVVYSDSSPTAYIFAGGEIDLSTMDAGDTILITLSKRIMPLGALIPYDLLTFNDAQPAGHLIFHVNALPDVYGLAITMEQTAGVLRTIDCEFVSAKRIGLD
jgi:hypothetical protein